MKNIRHYLFTAIRHWLIVHPSSRFSPSTGPQADRSLTTKTAEPAGIAGHHPRRALVRSGVPH